MEALSIQAVKANYRPAETQAQGELGDIFQVLLRDSVEQQEAFALPPRADDRPERDAPRRSLSDKSVGISDGDRRDRPADRDTDFSAYDGPAAVEPRPASAKEDTTASTEVQATTRQSSTSDQPPVARDVQEAAPARGSDTPAPNGLQTAEEQTSAPSGNSVVVLDTVLANTSGLGVAATNVGVDRQANAAVTGTPGKAAPIQTQNPASSQPSAPSPGTSAAPAFTGGNGFSAQVSVTPAQIVATPNAGLGGGAASAAIAAAGVPGNTQTKTETATGTAPSAPVASATSLEAKALLSTDRQVATPSNAKITPTDGQVLAAGARSETRTGSALSSGLPKDAPIQTALAEAGSARPVQTYQTQGSGKVTGQNVAGQGDGAKPASARNHPAQSPSQNQTQQVANAAVQTGGATAPSQGPRFGEAGTSGGPAGSTDAASGRAASISSADMGGFTQALARGTDTLGSLTRSGGTHQTAANQVAVEIQKAVSAGKDQIRIRLHPAELGQIDVSLKVSNDGTVKAIVTIDRPETFDMMQRDARGLERALQDAGLKTDSGSLSFNLRGGDQQAPNDGQRGQGLTAQSNSESDRTADSQLPEADTPAPFISDHALDIRV